MHRKELENEIANLESKIAYGREHPYAGYCGDDDAMGDRLETLKNELVEMELTNDQIIDAVKQCIAHCQLLEESGRYEILTVREILYTLGYESDDADTIIKAMASGGFNYCIDPIIPVNGERVSRSVCGFGTDQLLSRLQCLSIRNTR